MTAYWLMKTEPDVFSLADLEDKKKSGWDGVRNYQARNYMRDDMKVGDRILFYHSSTTVPGVAGVAEVLRTGVVDPTQFDPDSEYYDAKSSPQNPRWWMVEVGFVEAFAEVISLAQLRADPELEGMLLLRPGQRLSVQPVEPEHFARIVAMGRQTQLSQLVHVRVPSKSPN